MGLHKKRCESCGKTKNSTEFGGNSELCNICVEETLDKCNLNDKFKKKVINGFTSKKNNFDITMHEYSKMFFTQGGRCLICTKHQNDLNRILHVDHCHTTGVVRGLLCADCNMMLGFAKDNIDTLQRAIEYLMEF